MQEPEAGEPRRPDGAVQDQRRHGRADSSDDLEQRQFMTTKMIRKPLKPLIFGLLIVNQ
jgi:hypothetical protein